MWGKNPHSDELCDDVKKKQQQEESCYRDTMTKSHTSNVHRRPTSDVHKRPTFDVHRRPPNQQTWSELTLLVNCLGRLHALNKKRNDTQTADFGRCLDCKPKNNWLRLGVLVPPLFDGEKCKFPMLQLNLGGQICFIVPSVSVYVGIQEFASESSLFNVYIWCSQFLNSMESLWFKQLSTVILFSLLSTRVRNVPPKMLRCKWFKSQVPNEVKARLKRSTKRGEKVALETPAPKSNAKYKPRI